MQTVIIATGNAHKYQELRAMLGANWNCLSLAEFPTAPPVVEDQPTFSANAILKARSLGRWLIETGVRNSRLTVLPSVPRGSRVFILADDSGLEVDALGGAPGVLSARFAATAASAGNSSDNANNAKLLNLLIKVPASERKARFRCVLALLPLAAEAEHGAALGGEEPRLFEGTCEGKIDFGPRGGAGFGYDPLFIPAGYERSFAELSAEEKNSISHRSQALQLLKGYLDGDVENQK